jgi:predicted Zn-dependent protease with MMP-like domain
VEITSARFEELVVEAVGSLPEWIRKTMDNVEVFVEDGSAPGQRDLLGLYEGVPLAKRGSSYSGVLPDRITLFAGPILREARGDPDRLRSIVRHTVAHEVAHHFGISDERLVEIDAY